MVTLPFPEAFGLWWIPIVLFAAAVIGIIVIAAFALPFIMPVITLLIRILMFPVAVLIGQRKKSLSNIKSSSKKIFNK